MVRLTFSQAQTTRPEDPDIFLEDKEVLDRDVTIRKGSTIRIFTGLTEFDHAAAVITNTDVYQIRFLISNELYGALQKLFITEREWLTCLITRGDTPLDYDGFPDFFLLTRTPITMKAEHLNVTGE